MTSTNDALRDAETAALVALVEHGIRSDIQELLVRGDGRGTVAPGALRKAVAAALRATPPSDPGEVRAKALEEAARVADYQALCDREHGFPDAAEHADAIATAVRALISTGTTPPILARIRQALSPPDTDRGG